MVIASDRRKDRELASRIQSLPPFSPAACRLMQVIQQDSVHFREVAQALSVDAVLSSQVLRAANSALMGCRYEVASILQAVSVIGADRLRDIVITVAVKNYMGREDSLFMHRAWRHNLATALWCEKLADEYGLDAPIAYTAGMLHDIGRIALLKVFPYEYAIFMDQALTGDLDKREAERELCDVDHCQIGEALAQSWNFPHVLQDVIARHHENVTPESPRLRMLVQAACLAASMSRFYAAGPELPWDPARIEALLPPRPNARPLAFQELADEVVLRINQTECSLL